MKTVLAAFSRLRSEPEVIKQSVCAKPIDANNICTPLLRCLDEQRKRISAVRVPPTRLDAEQVWSAWERMNYRLDSLDGLQLRTLCTSEETALRTELIRALRTRPERLTSTLCLYGLVSVYFSHWRSMESPYQAEDLLRDALARYPRRNRVVEKWRHLQVLFSPEAAHFIADQVIRRTTSVEQVVEELSIGHGTKLALRAKAKAVEIATRTFDEDAVESVETALQKLRWFTDKLLVPPLPPDSFGAAISSLILSKTAEKFDGFRTALRAYLLSDTRLGDPRYRDNAPKWRSIAPQAHQNFLAWLARDSILFFFNTILPDSSENRRRKEFWLQFHKNIRDFQVAVSEPNYHRIRATQDTSTLPMFSRVKDVTTSAFLLQFAGYAGDYVIVEFSETGNAAHIYEKTAFCSTGVTLRSFQFDVKKHLKHDKKTDRIIHNGAWEYYARRKLIELGIRP